MQSHALLTGIILAACCAGVHATAASRPVITVSASTNVIGMGRSVELRARAVLPSGMPATNWLLLPYCNGQRWGAHEHTDANGCATFQIPLPRPGKHAISISAMPLPYHAARWIWTDPRLNLVTSRFVRAWWLSSAPTATVCYLAVDDCAELRVNGTSLGMFHSWRGKRSIGVPISLLRPGSNVVEIIAINHGGPAGCLFELKVHTADGSVTVESSPTWIAYDEEGQAVPLYDMGAAFSALWHLDDWPGMTVGGQLFTGAVLEPCQAVSEPVWIEVQRRPLCPPPKDPRALVIMQWENWFSPSQVFWNTAHAVPLVGFYRTSNTDVMRQHLIWMIESGVDIIQCDMSNNIWHDFAWDARAPWVNELIFLNQLMLETMASMRDEGYAVPRFVILGGINYTTNKVQVINDQLTTLYHAFVNNPRWGDLYYRLEGKPLMLLLAVDRSFHEHVALLDPRWTIRLVALHHEPQSPFRARGDWSWVDWQATPSLNNEAITASIGCFPPEGWLHPLARGRRGGATLVEDWCTVMRERPRHVILHQFQEFCGDAEGFGQGPGRTNYYDSYSVDLSDDIEPTSLTTPAYRGQGGWGFFYLNLVRACVDLLRQRPPITTVLTIAQPSRNQRVSGEQMTLVWRCVGKEPRQGVCIVIDGRVAVSNITEQTITLDIRALTPGLHTVTVSAPGAVQRYRLSWTEDSLPLSELEPASVSTTFIREL